MLVQDKGDVTTVCCWVEKGRWKTQSFFPDELITLTTWIEIQFK